MNKDEVLKLAKLARIEIPESEAEKLSHEFEAILQYVGDIKNAKLSIAGKTNLALKNVFREDTSPHESGIYTEAILSEAPQREGQYVKVKKIL